MKSARLALRALNRWLEKQHPEPDIIAVHVRDTQTYSRDSMAPNWVAEVQVAGERSAAAWTVAVRRPDAIHWHLDAAPGVRLILVEHVDPTMPEAA